MDYLPKSKKHLKRSLGLALLLATLITTACDTQPPTEKAEAPPPPPVEAKSEPTAPEPSPTTSSPLTKPDYAPTEAGALEYFTQEFEQPSIRFEGEFPPHPRLLFDREGLMRARERHQSGEAPYAQVAQALIAKANGALTTQIKGPITSPSCLEIAGNMVHDGVMANDLALAYRLTDNEDYARRAFEIIDLWIYAEPLAGSTWEFDVRGCPGMDYARTFVYMASAWDLLTDHPEATPKRAAAFEEVLRYHAALMKIDLKHWADNDYLGRQYFQNHMVANSFGLLWVGNVLGDRDLVQYALDHSDNPRDWSELLNGMFYVEGQPMLELILGLDAPAPKTGEITDRYRHHEAPGKGMVYAMLSLTLMNGMAEIADHIGVDLYATRGTYGESLEDALSYYGAMLAERDLGWHNSYLEDERFFNDRATYWAANYLVAEPHYPDNETIRSVVESIDPITMANHIHYPFPWTVLTADWTLPEATSMSTQATEPQKPMNNKITSTVAAITASTAISAASVTIEAPATVSGTDEVRRWSLPSTPKSERTGSNETYGSDGYLFFGTDGTTTPPSATQQSGLENEPVRETMSGIEPDSTIRNLIALPAYVSKVYLLDNDYTRINPGPAKPELTRPTPESPQDVMTVGNLAAKITSPLGEGTYFGNLLSFQLEPGYYRVGVMTDFLGGQYAPEQFNLYHAKAIQKRSIAAAVDGQPDMHFFDLAVEGKPAVFMLAGLHSEPTIGTLAGIVWERLPAPSEK